MPKPKVKDRITILEPSEDSPLHDVIWWHCYDIGDQTIEIILRRKVNNEAKSVPEDEAD